MNPDISFIQELPFEQALVTFCNQHNVDPEDVLEGIEWVISHNYRKAVLLEDAPKAIYVLRINLRPHLAESVFMFFYLAFLREDNTNQLVIHFEDIQLDEFEELP